MKHKNLLSIEKNTRHGEAFSTEKRFSRLKSYKTGQVALTGDNSAFTSRIAKESTAYFQNLHFLVEKRRT